LARSTLNEICCKKPDRFAQPLKSRWPMIAHQPASSSSPPKAQRQRRRARKIPRSFDHPALTKDRSGLCQQQRVHRRCERPEDCFRHVKNVALLQDPKSGIQITFVTGGVSDGKHAPGILSLGTVYNQPYWIFYSSTEPLDRLSQLKGKRIAVGPEGSGTRLSAEKILGKGGVNSETATLLPFAGLAAVKAPTDKKVDAVWIIGSPDATAVKSFLENPDVRLLGFPMAEAYTRIFPELVRLVLPKGVVDIDRTIPADDSYCRQ
jgi:hypothetical protein